MTTDDINIRSLLVLLAKGVGVVAGVVGVVVLLVAILATRARSRAYGKLS